MPKFIIKEQDNTGVVQQSSISNVVFTPIVYSSQENPSAITLVKSVEELRTFYGITGATEKLKLKAEREADKSYRLAKHLINIGFEVLTQKVSAVGNVQWTKLKDKGLYDIRFLVLPSGGNTEQKAMANCAQSREDCVALCNIDEGQSSFTYTITDIRTAFETIAKSTYCAGFTPWFYTKEADILGYTGTAESPVLETETIVPAAYGYLFAYANSVKNNAEWLAVAGPQRGGIPELYRVCYTYTTDEIEILQARSVNSNVELDDDEDNVGVAINAIAYVRPSGYIIYGNRTLHNNTSPKKTIASSFLNIRNGVNAIKKVMYDASRKYAFEQNTKVLKVNFESYVNPLLDKMETGSGLLGYRWVETATTAKARLKDTLKIVPVEAVEDFDLLVSLEDSLEVVEA